MNIAKTQANSAASTAWLDYRTVWRWHFYAGLFCIPFVVLLSLTGALYLFKPQIEAWIDRPYDHLSDTAPRASAAAQIDAALASQPGAQLLVYQLPTAADTAVRVLLQRNGDAIRVYVHPKTLQILNSVREEQRFMRVVRTLHGELMIGNAGSLLVELAASWTIVMLITGLYLWWPRQLNSLMGTVLPRIGRGQRVFWRDLHAVTGLWISIFALFLLLSGLPWAKFWGGYFKEVRKLTGTAVLQQDWSSGRSRASEEMSAQGISLEHLQHHHETHQTTHSGEGDSYAELDRVIDTVAALKLAPPVLINPANDAAHTWLAKSDAQNRTLRVNLAIDGRSGAIIKRESFGDRHIIDRIIGTSVAAHEGQLFGWFNQLLGLLTACGLVLLCLSAVVLWWRRRERGALGAPAPMRPLKPSAQLIAVIILLGIYLPLFALSLAAIVALEKYVLCRISRARIWLGLPAA